MLNSFTVSFGAVLLACGICSPAAGSLNKWGPELVFWGLTLIVVALYSDHCKDKRDTRR